LVLLGDHLQLQPLVLAKNFREPEEKRVSRSLMERTLDAGHTACMLKTQYRMFEGLCAIVSSLFYHSELVTAPEKSAQDKEEEGSGLGGGSGQTFKRGAQVEVCWEDGEWYPAVVKRPHPQGGCFVDWEGETLYIPGEWIRRPQRSTKAVFADARTRLRWFDCSVATETAVGTSYVNTLEVAMIRELLHTDPVLSETPQRVKVITLYKPQVQLMQKTCADIVQRRPNVEFVTVDACQGTEAPHIVLSTVRSCRGRIGFASNPRRLNVAISRAIKSLTLVGSAHALSGDKNWAKVHQGFKHMGQVSGVKLAAVEASRVSGWADICREAAEMAERQSRRAPEPEIYESHENGFRAYGSKGFGGKGYGSGGLHHKGLGSSRSGTKGYGGKGAGGKGLSSSRFGSKGCGGKGAGGKDLGASGLGGKGLGGKRLGGKGLGGKGLGGSGRGGKGLKGMVPIGSKGPFSKGSGSKGQVSKGSGSKGPFTKGKGSKGQFSKGNGSKGVAGTKGARKGSGKALFTGFY